MKLTENHHKQKNEILIVFPGQPYGLAGRVLAARFFKWHRV